MNIERINKKETIIRLTNEERAALHDLIIAFRIGADKARCRGSIDDSHCQFIETRVMTYLERISLIEGMEDI